MGDLTKKLTQQQSSPPEPIQELKFEKGQHLPKLENQTPQNPVTMATDMVMLNRADSWMLQFKQRLYLGILGILLAWAGLAYNKGLETPAEIQEVKAPRILADGSHDSAEDVPVYSVSSDNLVRSDSADSNDVRPAPAEALSESTKLEDQVKTRASKKTSLFQMSAKSKTQLLKSKARNQKKNKKSVAAKTNQN